MGAEEAIQRKGPSAGEVELGPFGRDQIMARILNAAIPLGDQQPNGNSVIAIRARLPQNLSLEFPWERANGLSFSTRFAAISA